MSLTCLALHERSADSYFASLSGRVSFAISNAGRQEVVNAAGRVKFLGNNT